MQAADAMSNYYFKNHKMVEIDKDEKFQIKKDFYEKKFAKKKKEVQKELLDEILSMTAHQMREHIYCYIYELQLKNTEISGICFKKGFFTKVRNHLANFVIDV